MSSRILRSHHTPPYNQYHWQSVRIWQSSTIHSVIALDVLCKGDQDMIMRCSCRNFPQSRVWPFPSLLLCLVGRIMHAACQVKHLRAVLVSLLFVGLGWNFEDDRRSIPGRGCSFTFPPIVGVMGPIAPRKDSTTIR